MKNVLTLINCLQLTEEQLSEDFYHRISNLNANVLPTVSEGMRKQIDLDLLRTFPTNTFFQKDGSAIMKLKRVLTAHLRFNPFVQYCQGFNFIAGFALLFMSEVGAFWCLAAIVGRIMPRLYYVDPMTASRADQPALNDCCKRWMPEVHAVLEKYGFDLSMVTFNWFFTWFVDCLPASITLRIWDVLLLEGDIVLFRFAYAVLKLHEDDFLNPTSEMDIFTMMRSIGTACHDAEVVMRLAFDECPFDMEYVKERRYAWRAELGREDEELKRRYPKASLEGESASAPVSVPGSQPSSPLTDGDTASNCDSGASESFGSCTGSLPSSSAEASLATAAATFEEKEKVVTDGATTSATAKTPAATLPHTSADASLSPPSSSLPRLTAEDILGKRASTRPVSPFLTSLHQSAGSVASLSSITMPQSPRLRTVEQLKAESAGRPVSTTSINSVESWIQVEKSAASSYEQSAQSISPRHFSPRKLQRGILSPQHTGGAGDGRLLPAPGGLSQSVGHWREARLGLPRSIRAITGGHMSKHSSANASGSDSYDTDATLRPTPGGPMPSSVRESENESHGTSAPSQFAGDLNRDQPKHFSSRKGAVIASDTLSEEPSQPPSPDFEGLSLFAPGLMIENIDDPEWFS